MGKLEELEKENKLLRAQVELLTQALKSSNKVAEETLENLKSQRHRVYREEE